MESLCCNGHHSGGHIKCAFNVEHQFSAADGLKRAFKHQCVVDIHWGVTALHIQVFVSFPNAYWIWQAPAHCVRPNTVRGVKWKVNGDYFVLGSHKWWRLSMCWLLSCYCIKKAVITRLLITNVLHHTHLWIPPSFWCQLHACKSLWLYLAH